VIIGCGGNGIEGAVVLNNCTNEKFVSLPNYISWLTAFCEKKFVANLQIDINNRI